MTDEFVVTLLTDDELDELASQLPHVKAWTKAVEDELLRALEAGTVFKNVSLEPKSATRKWESSFDALATLRKFSDLDVVAPRVPLTPTQAEKILGKSLYVDRLAEFVVRQSSGMKLTYSHPETEKD